MIVTTSRPMLSRRAEFSRGAVRWLLPAALLALAPKCLLCVLAYAGLGAAFGLGGPELCGALEVSPSTWATSLAWFGVAGGIGMLGFLASCRRVHSAPAGRSQFSARAALRAPGAVWELFVIARCAKRAVAIQLDCHGAVQSAASRNERIPEQPLVGPAFFCRAER